MKTFIEQSEDTRILGTKCKHLVSSVFGMLKPEASFVKIPANTNIATDPAAQGKLLVLKEGYLTYALNGQKLFFYEQGDLVGLENLYGGSKAEISSSFTTSVDVYDVKKVLEAFQTKPDLLKGWNELLVHLANLSTSILATVTRDQVHFTPNEQSIEPGQTIIEQGSIGHEVFALVSGHCVVTADGAKVGEVLEGELFGVLAALSNSPRTASVIATQQSRVISLHVDNFIELVRYRPSTALKMVESMARTIVNLNHQVSRTTIATTENLRGG